MKSWRTTLGGILIAVGSYFQTVNDPAWLTVLGTAFVGIGGLLVGGSARDHGVSSEKAGAK